jgi:methionine-rich copper-binding protein CopC
MHKLASAAVVGVFSFALACSGGGELPCQRDQECLNADATGICDPATSACGSTTLPMTVDWVGYVEDEVTVVFRFDPVEPSAVEVMLDGTIVGDAVAEAGWVYTIDKTSLTEGTHWLRPVVHVGEETLYGRESAVDVARPPHVVSQTPAENATDVPVPFTLEIQFDVPVTLPYGGARIYAGDYSGDVLPSRSTLSSDKRTLTVSVQHPEQLGSSVNVSYTVRDSRGDDLDRYFSLYLVPPQADLFDPAGDLITSLPVVFRAWISGGPERVEVLAGDGIHIEGVVLGRMTVTGGAGTFTWDTTTVTPGTYDVWLRATRGGLARTSEAVTITVAR